MKHDNATTTATKEEKNDNTTTREGVQVVRERVEAGVEQDKSDVE